MPARLVDIRPQVARHQGSITGALLIDPAAIAEQLSMLGYDHVTTWPAGTAWRNRTARR